MNLSKKNTIITISVLILLAIIIFFLLFLKQNEQNNQFQQGAQSTDISQQDKGSSLESYNDYQAQAKAIYKNNIDDCQALEETKKINKCINSMAIEMRRKDYCDKIINDEELKAECLDSIDYMSISWGSNPNQCATLSNLIAQDACFIEYFMKLNNANQCNIVLDEERKTECLNTVYTRLALVFNQPENCDFINDSNLKANCKNNVITPPLDSDHDGLIDTIELSFGTNPFKADTDGDSKSDYEEINKYHTDPLTANSLQDFTYIHK